MLICIIEQQFCCSRNMLLIETLIAMSLVFLYYLAIITNTTLHAANNPNIVPQMLYFEHRSMPALYMSANLYLFSLL